MAKEISDEAQTKENTILGDYENKIGGYINVSRDNQNINKGKNTIWQGIANEDTTYELDYKNNEKTERYSIKDFDYLVIYGDCDDKLYQATTIIPTNQIEITNEVKYSLLVGLHANDSYYWRQVIYFNSEYSFKINWSGTFYVGWSQGYIKQIDGIKL